MLLARASNCCERAVQGGEVGTDAGRVLGPSVIEAIGETGDSRQDLQSAAQPPSAPHGAPPRRARQIRSALKLEQVRRRRPAVLPSGGLLPAAAPCFR